MHILVLLAQESQILPAVAAKQDTIILHHYATPSVLRNISITLLFAQAARHLA